MVSLLKLRCQYRQKQNQNTKATNSIHNRCSPSLDGNKASSSSCCFNHVKHRSTYSGALTWIGFLCWIEFKDQHNQFNDKCTIFCQNHRQNKHTCALSAHRYSYFSPAFISGQDSLVQKSVNVPYSRLISF